jgi:predicted aminopeptidase
VIAVGRLRGAAAALLVVTAAGCFEAGYVLQAAQGQLDIVCSTRDIDRALRDEDVDPWKRELLAQVDDIKRFASASGLTPTPSYEDYVELDRPVAVYVVSASHPLRFEGLRWSFPIVGSVPYLGWFDRPSAVEFADELRDAGWDVDLRGARAYSTLGWFDDPVLSSMLEDGPAGPGELANVVLHESLHATLYVPSQSSFNESVASFVGDHLAGRWLAGRFGPDSMEEVTYREGLVESAERTERLHRAFSDLDALYKSKRPPDAVRAEKARYLDQLRSELDMARQPNNATLMGFRTYESGHDELVALHAACGQDMRRFLKAIATVNEKSFDEPQQEDVGKVVRAIIARGCPR